MKNTLTDLNNHLFMCLERLNDESMSDDQLEKEVKRCDAISKIASTIVANSNTQLNAFKCANEYGIYKSLPHTILDTEKDDV